MYLRDGLFRRRGLHLSDAWKPSISFSDTISSNIQTLSTNTVSAGSDVEGLLYVPDLNKTDPCFNMSSQYIPSNVTRQANLPSTDYTLIALAPWISIDCTKAYLASASIDGARAFLFYRPQNSTANNPSPPNPPPNDDCWDLQDGGAWKSEYKYPVYAIPPNDGFLGMQQLAQYSGNMTDAPQGHLLTERYDSRNYVRLYCTIDTGSASTLPSLWFFLLIVLGMLLLIFGLTSLLMHYLQRRRRIELRNLIASGQVDLEALGIKRLKVPQEVLEAMTLYVYVAFNGNEQSWDSAPLPSAYRKLEGRGPVGETPTQHYPQSSLTPRPANQQASTAGSTQPTLGLPSAESLPHRQPRHAQPTCAICLEDFVSDESIVRELPCGHIYHAECIDPMLRDYSSLCPVCKGKVLPRGYCPTVVTNGMVRRERLIRRMREHVQVEANRENRGTYRTARNAAIGSRMANFHHQFRRTSRANRSNPPELQQHTAVELSQISPSATIRTTAAAGFDNSTQIVALEDRARQRATAILGHERTVDEEDREQEASVPACKYDPSSRRPNISQIFIRA